MTCTYSTRSLEDHEEDECLQEVLSDPLVRGFLHKGAADICHQKQLKPLSAHRKHFYPEGQPPRNKKEYINNVRNVQDILNDPWFTEENGRPSITALLGKVMVGNFVLEPNNDIVDRWQESSDHVEKNAVQYDGQAIAPPICANKGWTMEMMSPNKPTSTSSLAGTRRAGIFIPGTVKGVKSSGMHSTFA
jgi:hypothetical protein